MSKHNHPEYDLYDDLEKIKAALRIASKDVKGKAGDILTHSLENVEGRAGELKKNVYSYVENEPLKSLGIAALVGLVIGMYIKK